MRPVSLLVALFIALPLAAQVIPETPVSDAAYFHNSEKIEAAASDGQNFLVAGLRGGIAYAHRLTASGELLDGTGIRMAIPAYETSTILGIFWGNDAYTLVMRSSMTPSTLPGATTWVARIDRDGKLIVPAHQIAAGPVYYHAASNGRRIVLAGPRLAVLDLQGEMIETDIAMPVQPGSIGESFQRIASNGDGFMVTWGTSTKTENDVAVAPLDRNGHPTGTMAIAQGIGFTQEIASDGNDYVVVYQVASGTHFAQHVSVAGEMLERFALPRLSTQVTRLLWTGTSYLLAVLNTPPSIAFATPSAFRLGRNGAPSEGIQSVLPGSVAAGGTLMVMATNGRQISMFWPEGASDSFRWFGGFLGADLNVAGKFPIGATATLQFAPSAATDGRNLFTVWEENDAVYGSLLSFATGQRGARIALSSTLPGHTPRVIWDGHAYVVAWRSGSTNPKLTTAQVSPDGAILQAAEKPAMNGCVDAFDLASDGGEAALVVASGCWGINKYLYATRVHRDGNAEPAITLTNTPSGFPSVAWSGTQYLLAWYENTNANGLDYPVYRGNVRAARLSPSLTVLDTAPLAIDVHLNEENSLPVVATDGRDFMIAWTHEDQFNPSLRARSVSAGGALGDVVSLGPGTTSSLIWDGRGFALAFNTPSTDILLTRIGTGTASLIAHGGTVVNTIEPTNDQQIAVGLVPLGNNVIAAAYVRTATEAIYGSVPRVFVKTLGASRGRAVRR